MSASARQVLAPGPSLESSDRTLSAETPLLTASGSTLVIFDIPHGPAAGQRSAGSSRYSPRHPPSLRKPPTRLASIGDATWRAARVSSTRGQNLSAGPHPRACWPNESTRKAPFPKAALRWIARANVPFFTRAGAADRGSFRAAAQPRGLYCCPRLPGTRDLLFTAVIVTQSSLVHPTTLARWSSALCRTHRGRALGEVEGESFPEHGTFSGRRNVSAGANQYNRQGLQGIAPLEQQPCTTRGGQARRYSGQHHLAITNDRRQIPPSTRDARSTRASAL